MKVKILETYETGTKLFRAGRVYDLASLPDIAQTMIEGGFAQEVKRKRSKAETAEDNPHKPQKRTRRKAENASDDS